ncbi:MULTISPECIES: T9SS type A sorting domain-containing protein [Bizionia]|uniref:T9SS type A sorting domain-containing protein n=1 Tax=Bizionia algoritergicola TaxID=291187 RepID=A0A5D0QU81_9FLAO|nr:MULTISPECIES: T9SS type A sorting domain-containing protein [Bizionia]OBX22895.1 hypothetical protein BAA08_06345 [Bizionia sp. APA-3]TYB72793.1 T9SS type A sorting domain-containing protein [Bizionia algoritergicola]
MKKILLICFAFLIGNHTISAQTTLTAGDIAFVALNADGSVDQFSFVLLKTIESGTEIKFTDQGWTDGVGFNNTNGDNGVFVWTATSGLTIGTVVNITTNNGNGTPIASIGSCSGSAMLISIIGDQIFAFQGTFDSSASFITAIHFNLVAGTTNAANWDGASSTNSTSALPDTLTNGVNAIWVYNILDNSEIDNMIYNCAVAIGDVSVVRAAINNVANWTVNNITEYVQIPFPCSFSPTLSIQTGVNSKKASVFPNPTNGLVNLKLNDLRNVTVNIYNIAGQLIYSENSINSENFSFNLNVDSGMYLMELRSEQQTQQFKLIKK